MYNTSIRVGSSTTVKNNAVCKSGINNQGIFNCNSPLTGKYLGLTRETDYCTCNFSWAEIRAYEFPPLTITTGMLSTNEMPNASLNNSLNFSMTSIEL